MKILLAILFAICAGVPHRTYAFFDPPYVTPPNPVAGDTIFVNIYGGGCDAIIGAPGYPQITQDGNAIRILFFSVHEDDPDFCIYGTGTATQAVGIFPAGSYTLQVDRTYTDLFGPHLETLGVVPFTVAGAQRAAAVPSMTAMSETVAILAIVAIGFIYMRRRRFR